MGATFSLRTTVTRSVDRMHGDDNERIREVQRDRYFQGLMEAGHTKQYNFLEEAMQTKTREALDGVFASHYPHLAGLLLLNSVSRTPKLPYWINPYSKMTDDGRKIEQILRFHDSRASFARAQWMSMEADVDIEPEMYHTGAKRPPYFLLGSDMLNKDLRVMMRPASRKRERVLNCISKEHKYLSEHLKFLVLRIESVCIAGEYELKFFLKEIHKKSKSSNNERDMFPMHMWILHGNHPAIILRGVDFELMLCPNNGRLSIPAPPNSNTAHLIGFYKRYMGDFSHMEDAVPMHRCAYVSHHF